VLVTPDLPAPDPEQLLSVSAVPGDRPGHVFVEVNGVVDTSTAPLLQLCLDSQITNRSDLRELVVDIEQASSLDAAGVAALVRAHRRCWERGVRLVLRCAGRRRALGPLPLPELADLVDVDPVEPARPPSRARRTATRPRPTPWRLSRDAGR
jgi:anti-anti-sigma factor